MSTEDESNDPKEQAFDSAAFLKTVPSKAAGVYRMLDQNRNILYIGKAKQLRNRLSSYFRGTHSNSRIFSMIKQIRQVEITITHTEAEALLLESNLIKRHKPRYNILHKDGKSYPYIYVSTEHTFPRVQFYRGSRNRPGEFFGPYPSAKSVRQALYLLKKLFKVRQCEDSYFANRSRPCLEYQIKRCSAPCTNEITAEAYAESVRNTLWFLQGKTQAIITKLVDRMEDYAEQLNFEKAAETRDLIEDLRQISQQQYINNGSGNVDVVAIEKNRGTACVQVFSIRNGNNLGNRSYFPTLPDPAIESTEVLSYFLSQYYLTRDVPSEILTNTLPKDKDVLEEMLTIKQCCKIHIRRPKRGESVQWLELAHKNAVQSLEMHSLSKQSMQARLLDLKSVLGLDHLPERMECFDISHTQGELTVASCVVFNARGPVTADYRLFNIEGITPGDDYAAMKQALQRRFRRVTQDDQKKPDVLFIDGGKGQVAQALQVLETLDLHDIEVIGVSKGEGRKPGLETLIMEKNTQKLNLPESSPALHWIQQIRDESHRFAITGHRARRHKARLSSPLEDIAGLGAKRRTLLLKQFGGIRGVERASIEELAKVSGISLSLAQRIYSRFNEG